MLQLAQLFSCKVFYEPALGFHKLLPILQIFEILIPIVLRENVRMFEDVGDVDGQDHGVMVGNKRSIRCWLQIYIDKVGTLEKRIIIRRNRMLRKVPRTATMCYDKWLLLLIIHVNF